ncbi:MAG: AraC family transcriptional regulator [Pseudomonadota bacterium]
MSVSRFDTSEAAPTEQLEYWNESICKVFIAMESAPYSPRTHDDQTRHRYRGSLETLDMGRIQLTRVECDSSLVQHKRYHVAQVDEDVCLLHMQLSGESVNRQRGNAAHLSPGEFTVCDSATPYSVDFDRPIEMIVVKIPHSLVDPRMLASRQLFASPQGQRGEVPPLLQRHLENAWDYRHQITSDAQRQHLADATLSIIHCTLEQAGVLRGQAQRRNDFLGKAAHQYVCMHATDPRLCASQVAAALNVSERTLRYAFADQATTFSALLAKVRVAKAKTLLREQPRGHQRRIIEIALRCGYQSASHFNRQFRAQVGMAPTAYRDQPNAAPHTLEGSGER